MSQRTPRRYRTAAGTARRQPRIRRASAGLTPIRSAAVLAMLVTGGAIYGLAAGPAFGLHQISVSGNALVAESTIRSAVALAPGTNLVGLDTSPIVGRLLRLPAIAGVDIRIGLPETLDVRLRERHPIVVWAVADKRLAVDDDGLLFADVTGDAAAEVAGIPVVRDDRSKSASLTVGASLDSVVRDAATRLGSLTPSQIGSDAGRLAVRISDERGFTVGSGAGGWTAVFGFYGRSQRTPELIPGQVQLLTALIAGREDTVQMVILADGRDGTFIPKPSPNPSTSLLPSRAP